MYVWNKSSRICVVISNEPMVCIQDYRRFSIRHVVRIIATDEHISWEVYDRYFARENLSTFISRIVEIKIIYFECLTGEGDRVGQLHIIILNARV